MQALSKSYFQALNCIPPVDLRDFWSQQIFQDNNESYYRSITTSSFLNQVLQLLQVTDNLKFQNRAIHTLSEAQNKLVQALLMERRFLLNLLKVLIIPGAPTLQMLMANQNARVTSKTPSFGQRPCTSQNTPNSLIMQYNYLFNRKENVQIQYQHRVSTSPDDDRADIESVGSAANVLDRSFLESQKPGVNGCANARISIKNSKYPTKAIKKPEPQQKQNSKLLKNKSLVQISKTDLQPVAIPQKAKSPKQNKLTVQSGPLSTSTVKNYTTNASTLMALSQISKPKKINPISKLEEESSESGYRLGFNKKKSESRYQEVDAVESIVSNQKLNEELKLGEQTQYLEKVGSDKQRLSRLKSEGNEPRSLISPSQTQEYRSTGFTFMEGQQKKSVQKVTLDLTDMNQFQFQFQEQDQFANNLDGRTKLTLKSKNDYLTLGTKQNNSDFCSADSVPPVMIEATNMSSEFSTAQQKKIRRQVFYLGSTDSDKNEFNFNK